MPTSFVASDSIFMFAVGLASSARVFTLTQLTRHPQLRDRTQSMKRAWDCLSPHRDSFEVLPWIHGKPHIWRLTETEKQLRGVRYRRVGVSQHTEHWLAIGDVWSHLVFNGLRPTKWFTEGKQIGRFDVFAEIRGKPYLMEVQLSPLSDREWKTKWNKRIEWLRTEPWRDAKWSESFAKMQPTMVLVTTEAMRPLLPEAALYARTIDQLHHVIKRPPQ